MTRKFQSSFSDVPGDLVGTQSDPLLLPPNSQPLHVNFPEKEKWIHIIPQDFKAKPEAWSARLSRQSLVSDPLSSIGQTTQNPADRAPT